MFLKGEGRGRGRGCRRVRRGGKGCAKPPSTRAPFVIDARGAIRRSRRTSPEKAHRHACLVRRRSVRARGGLQPHRDPIGFTDCTAGPGTLSAPLQRESPRVQGAGDGSALSVARSAVWCAVSVSFLGKGSSVGCSARLITRRSFKAGLFFCIDGKPHPQLAGHVRTLRRHQQALPRCPAVPVRSRNAGA